MSTSNEPRNPSETARRLLTSLETAAMLALSPRKLWELTNRGIIPHLRIGRCVRYDQRDLELWIEQQKRQPRACG